MKATIDACFAKKIMEKNNLDYFSVAALDVIIRYNDEISDVCGEEEKDFNPIEIFSVWMEYESIEAIAQDYGYIYTLGDWMEEHAEELKEKTDDEIAEMIDNEYFDVFLDKLAENTSVLFSDDSSFVVRKFYNK